MVAVKAELPILLMPQKCVGLPYVSSFGLRILGTSIRSVIPREYIDK